MNNKDLKELVIAIAKGLESTNNELVENVLLDNIRNAFQVSNEVQVQEVEKIVEVEKLVEVIPTEIQDELDSIKKQNQELQDEVKELQDALENVLETNDTLQARCDELHEQNEEYIKVLNEQETEEVSNESEEEVFEQVEEVSNDFILANSKTEEEIEADEELLFKELEEESKNDQETVLNDERVLNYSEEKETSSRKLSHKKVRGTNHTFGMQIPSDDNISNDLDCEFDEEPKRIKRNTSFTKFNSYGRERQTRKNVRSASLDNDTKTFMNYYKQIKSGKLNETNVNEESIQEIYDLAIKVNNGVLPTEVLNLYNTIIGDEN